MDKKPFADCVGGGLFLSKASWELMNIAMVNLKCSKKRQGSHKEKWRVIMKLYQSEKKENESISGAYVQAKIIRKEDKKIYLRIWNSGTEPAYNVNFYIPKGHRICVLRSRMDCKVLKPGQAFDEYAVADEKLLKDVAVVTYWEDESGCLYSMEQTEPARNIFKKICV